MIVIEHHFETWPWQFWLNERPHEIAIAVGRLTFTWQQLSDQIDCFAIGLLDQGVTPDQVVAAVAENSIELIWLHLATLRIGARFVAISTKTAELEINSRLSTVAADHLWCGDNDALMTGDWQQVALISGIKRNIGVTWQPARAASLIFTSGSGGKPKAVVHSIDNHLYSAAGLLSMINFSAADSWLLSLPLSHISGLAILWRWLFAGSKLVLPQGKDLQQNLSQVTHASLVPTQLQRLLQTIDQTNNLKLKQILLGGARIPVELTRRAKDFGIDCWVGYGMTEMSSTVVAKHANDSSGVGQVIPNREIKITAGEMFVRGKTLCLGYFKYGKICSLQDPQGWFATKDMAKIEGGEVFILGRQDNMFISGGENIHPEQIENLLMTHPLVATVVVIAVANDEFGQRPVAVIDGLSDINKAQMDQFLEGKIDKIKWPERYYCMPPALATSQTKVLRRDVLRWFSDHADLRD